MTLGCSAPLDLVSESSKLIINSIPFDLTSKCSLFKMLIEGYRCVWGGGVELPGDRCVDTDTSAVEAELEEFIQAVGGARGLAAAARWTRTVYGGGGSAAVAIDGLTV